MRDKNGVVCHSCSSNQRVVVTAWLALLFKLKFGALVTPFLSFMKATPMWLEMRETLKKFGVLPHFVIS